MKLFESLPSWNFKCWLTWTIIFGIIWANFKTIQAMKPISCKVESVIWSSFKRNVCNCFHSSFFSFLFFLFWPKIRSNWQNMLVKWMTICIRQQLQLVESYSIQFGACSLHGCCVSFVRVIGFKLDKLNINIFTSFGQTLACEYFNDVVFSWWKCVPRDDAEISLETVHEIPAYFAILKCNSMINFNSNEITNFWNGEFLRWPESKIEANTQSVSDTWTFENLYTKSTIAMTMSMWVQTLCFVSYLDEFEEKARQMTKISISCNWKLL